MVVSSFVCAQGQRPGLARRRTRDPPSCRPFAAQQAAGQDTRPDSRGLTGSGGKGRLLIASSPPAAAGNGGNVCCTADWDAEETLAAPNDDPAGRRKIRGTEITVQPN